ncbi:MAG: UDP-N-acetylmuramate dehydrogenase [Oscillospiraceae bacterium]|jgi:UDP-N-acetylmuramate dehydrogenase|nr:UDP-N-acetylmuramate dehydrogenase [Oscillospiraceae bacterium]
MPNFAADVLRAAETRGIACAANVLMQSKTSFRIGGAAQAMLFPATLAQLRVCLSLCAAEGAVPFILGNGSNLLVKDSGLDGVVISSENLQSAALLEGNRIRCEAGMKLSELCVLAQKNGLAGLAFAYGIPGTAGGAVYMNAGAYGGEMRDVLVSVEYIDRAGKLHALPADRMELGYRHSVFAENEGVIFALTVQLARDEPSAIRAQMQGIMARRREKQPLEFPSAGSVFKRPEGQYAGALIERCGLKGRQIGGAQVSEKHAGFIINRGGARAADVRALIAVVQATVERETGFLLVPEIKFV